MKRINILHLLPGENRPFLLKSLSHWQDHLHPERFQIHIACLPLQPQKSLKSEEKSLIYYLDPVWGKGLFQLARLFKTLNVHILHTHLEPAASLGLFMGKICRIPLFARTFFGDWHFPEPVFLPRKVLWRNFHRIAVNNVHSIGSSDFRSEIKAHCLFQNPPGFYEGLYQPPQFCRTETPRLVLLVESFSKKVITPPPVIRLAVQRVKKHFPQTRIRFQNFISPASNSLKSAPKDHSSSEQVFSVHLLLSEQASGELLILRFFELMLQGKSALVLGKMPEFPLCLQEIAKEFQKPLNPNIIDEWLQDSFQNPEQMARPIGQFQAICQRDLSLAKHCDNWKLHYEELIEESLNLKVSELKRTHKTDVKKAPELSDEKFLSLLQCPMCHSSFTWEISEKRQGRAWQGKLQCSQGHAFQILQGIPRILPKAEQEGLQPTQATISENPAPAYWQKKFYRNRQALYSHFRQILAPILHELKPGELVLDLDCTQGFGIEELVRHGAQAIGVYRGFISEKTQSLQQKYPQVRLVEADSFHAPFQTESFDRFYHLDASFCEANLFYGLEHWLALLKPDGRFHLFTLKGPFNGKSFPEGFLVLRSLFQKLPLALSSFAAKIIAFSQSFCKWGAWRQPKLNSHRFALLHSQWFRILRYPELQFPNENLLKKWLDTYRLHQIKIQDFPPDGIYVSAHKKLADRKNKAVS